MTECPICMEALFDEQGIAQNGNVAKIMCYHLVHSDCLAKAGRALNSDGKRYGVGGMGPRAGCPVCNRPTSMWFGYTEAAQFPLFWMNRIFHVLEGIGPNGGGPVLLKDVRNRLKQDATLTDRQKSYIKKKKGAHAFQDAFNEAVREGAKYYYWEEVDGGIRNGGYEKSGFRDNVWYWNKQTNELWLYKWGKVPKHMVMEKPICRIGYVAAHKQQPPQLERPFSAYSTIAILVIVAAILLSIYLDNGEEITW